MKKTVVILLVLALGSSVLLLSSCGSVKYDAVESGLPDEDAVTVFFGSFLDPIDCEKIIEEYKSDMGVNINPIFSDSAEEAPRQLERKLESSNPPDAYLIPREQDRKYLEDKGYFTRGEELIYSCYGVGLLIDKRLVNELVGLGNAEAFLEDLAKCEYDDWTAFIETLDEYIKTGTPGSFSLGNTEYKLLTKEGSRALLLDGVFALQGADSASYVGAIADAMYYNSVGIFVNFTGFADTMIFMTEHLAGLYAPAIRGADFINPEYMDRDAVHEIYKSGRAAFTLFDTRWGGSSDEIYDSSVFIPIKFTGGWSSHIAGGLEYSYALNAASDEKAEEALAFGEYLMEALDGSLTGPEASATEYYDAGKCFSADNRPQALYGFEQNVIQSEIYASFMSSKTIDEERRSEFISHLSSLWPMG